MDGVGREAHDDAWRETIQLFEAGRFWDAHEALEPTWLTSQGLDRALAAGVILMCAALHKSRVMGSERGGRRNFAKALRHLALLPNRYRGTDVRALEAEVHAGLRDPGRTVTWSYAVGALR